MPLWSRSSQEAAAVKDCARRIFPSELDAFFFGLWHICVTAMCFLLGFLLFEQSSPSVCSVPGRLLLDSSSYLKPACFGVALLTGAWAVHFCSCSLCLGMTARCRVKMSSAKSRWILCHVTWAPLSLPKPVPCLVLEFMPPAGGHHHGRCSGLWVSTLIQSIAWDLHFKESQFSPLSPSSSWLYTLHITPKAGERSSANLSVFRCDRLLGSKFSRFLPT